MGKQTPAANALGNIGALRLFGIGIPPLYFAAGWLLGLPSWIMAAMVFFAFPFLLVGVLPGKWVAPVGTLWTLALTIALVGGLFLLGPHAVPVWAAVVVMAVPSLAPLPVIPRTAQTLLWTPLLFITDVNGCLLLLAAMAIGWWVAHQRFEGHRDVEDTLGDLRRELANLPTQEPAPGREIAPRESGFDEQYEALLRHDRLSSLGRLAVGIGHEINNPLTVALVNIELMEADWDTPPDILKETRDALLRVRSIVADLARIARPEHEEIQTHFLDRLIKRAIEVARMGLKSALQMELYDIPKLSVMASRNRLEQVMVNLLVNASQATEGKGRVRISTEVGENRVFIHIDDDGPGIPQDKFDIIFEPFFTTKPVGKGTGLGLAISRSHMRGMEGDLLASSSPQGGARFTLALGKARTIPTQVSLSATAMGTTSPMLKFRPSSTSEPVLLIVDDDPMIRRTLTRGLSRQWTVVAVANTKEAMEVVKNQFVVVLLCDLNLGDEDALDVLCEIASVNPTLLSHTILMTGAPASGRMWSLAKRNHHWVLRKPFEMEKLLKWVDDAEDGHEPLNLNLGDSFIGHSPASLPPWDSSSLTSKIRED